MVELGDILIFGKDENMSWYAGGFRVAVWRAAAHLATISQRNLDVVIKNSSDSFEQTSIFYVPSDIAPDAIEADSSREDSIHERAKKQLLVSDGWAGHTVEKNGDLAHASGEISPAGSSRQVPTTLMAKLYVVWPQRDITGIIFNLRLAHPSTAISNGARELTEDCYVKLPA